MHKTLTPLSFPLSLGEERSRQWAQGQKGLHVVMLLITPTTGKRRGFGVGLQALKRSSALQ